MMLFLALLIGTPSLAWDEHQKIMALLVDSPAAQSRDYLDQQVKIPCTEAEKKTIQEISGELQVNAEKIPLYSVIARSEDCSKTIKIKVRELIRSQFIDEPDMGMDQDLPASADPKEYRTWMGGTSGPTSQGFRHMYFPGFKFSAPLSSLQYPLRAMGQAPKRFNQLHEVSERFFKEGDTFWGIRTLLWALHFVQDLHQPFHTTQIPSLKIIPFRTLFKGFVARTTQSVANYHFAYEGLILETMNEGPSAGMSPCMELKSKATPVADIFNVIRFSHQKGSVLGSQLVSLFPSNLKSKEIDLTRHENPDSLDYYSMIHSLDENAAFKATFEITCALMNQLSAYTWGELDQALTSISTTTGK